MQNRVPDDLYYAGVQRDRMAGFLDALKSRCEVVELDGGRDWRRGSEEEDEKVRKTTWYSSGDEAFELAWRETLGGQSGQSIFVRLGSPSIKDASPAAPMQISVYGRRVDIPAASGRACRFTFTELCEQVCHASFEPTFIF